MTNFLKNNRFIIVLGAVSMMYAVACQNPSASGTSNSNQTKSIEGSLELNHGEKWQVNQEMLTFIQEQEYSLKNFVNNKDSNFNILANSLYTSNQKLIKSCTMSGESHEQLHYWLHPHIQLIEALKKSESTNTSDSIVKLLQTSFNTYNQYFQ